MEVFSLKSKAVAFALCAGGIAFILALAATTNGRIDISGTAASLVAAIVCATMCWAYAEHAVANTAAAIDEAIARLARAANGDLEGEVPEQVSRFVPTLAAAMESLFRQMHGNLDTVQRLAMFDSVTDLPNRIHFRRCCERALAELPADAAAAIFFIDLDRFKAVNDTMGHATGDVLLGMVANRLRAVAARFADEPATGTGPVLIGRLAGDEFTMFFPDIREPRRIDRIGRAILFALGESFDLGGQSIEIGASVGVAVRPRHGRSLSELMRAADAAMYQAKANGRGCVEHFTEQLATEIDARTRLEQDLRTAVARDQFTLAFQPQVSAIDGRLIGAEALLRWRHPDGLRLPGSFIQRAEETGLIVEIGDWVIHRVAETIARWAKLGVEQRLAINISPRQLDHAGFFRRLRDALRAAGAPARLVELEITESLVMSCSDDVIDAIAQLRADGATVAIDDFGTGYSNLGRLQMLPVDRVKIDRSLIEQVAERTEARTIVQAVIGLVHGLGCEAVAEGIENAAQAEVMRVIGCDVLQGYAIGRPMEEATFLNWARDRQLMRAAS
ncbi:MULTISPECIES: putative bifunctional diguanylate cyclase/phosphodiesterase [unclassified Sphingomonas]|jgi:diguanylate cyclase (GGDEF)-like protein|uniref:putative bifunctional diguanylate cyclase/phosphodiesterase n=1 Tax=unclassified Sphingomonas TaxID=196159 RepID=UPI0008320E80|nr:MULTISPECIES: bifunctional diguanylate cyclase/phosphodiesterase [unclassified Sphingomonas]